MAVFMLLVLTFVIWITATGPADRVALGVSTGATVFLAFIFHVFAGIRRGRASIAPHTPSRAERILRCLTLGAAFVALWFAFAGLVGS